MVGHKLGEFSPTRMFRGHSGRKAAAPGAAGAGAGAGEVERMQRRGMARRRARD